MVPGVLDDLDARVRHQLGGAARYLGPAEGLAVAPDEQHWLRDPRQFLVRQDPGAPRRAREYLPYRMLEVEVAANAVYAWAAEEILRRRLAEEHPVAPAEYAQAVRLEAQQLRYRSHERLMRAFLDPEVFEGGVIVGRSPKEAGDEAQISLLAEG